MLLKKNLIILEEKRKHLKAKKNQIATSLQKLSLEKFFRAVWWFWIEWELHENDNGNGFQRRAAAAALWNIKRSARQVPGAGRSSSKTALCREGKLEEAQGLLSSGFLHCCSTPAMAGLGLGTACRKHFPGWETGNIHCSTTCVHQGSGFWIWSHLLSVFSG